MKLRHLITIILFAHLIGGCATLKTHRVNRNWAHLEKWDLNGNENLDKDEFMKGYRRNKFFTRWEQKSRPINDSIFVGQLFSFLDRNDDNILDSIEYSSGRVLWTFHGNKDLDEWDMNDDEIVARHEFRQMASDERLSDNYDLTSNGWITGPEMAESMFEVCDKNNDGKVGAIEFYLWEVYRQ